MCKQTRIASSLLKILFPAFIAQRIRLCTFAVLSPTRYQQCIVSSNIPESLRPQAA